MTGNKLPGGRDTAGPYMTGNELPGGREILR
jgi:hypothetical protein